MSETILTAGELREIAIRRQTWALTAPTHLRNDVNTLHKALEWMQDAAAEAREMLEDNRTGVPIQAVIRKLNQALRDTGREVEDGTTSS